MDTKSITIIVHPVGEEHAHHVRRSLPSIFRFRRTPKQPILAWKTRCSGPSVLHNLLPVVEPLCILQPKLHRLEDRILGRKRDPHPTGPFTVPSNLDELKNWVKEASDECDCDECSPKLYQIKRRKEHGKIKHRPVASRSRSIRVTQQPDEPAMLQPALKLRLYGSYEAMHLVRHHVAWLDQTYLQSPVNKQSPTLMQLKSLLHVWKSNLTGSNLRNSISRTQLQVLFPLINELFFFNAIPSHQRAFSSSFSWLPESRKNCFAVTYYNPLVGTHVLLHPTLYRQNNKPNDLDVRWRNRVGTIIHEMCHALLKAYTCRSCPMHDHCVGPRGHGRAWQVLAAKMEEVASVLLEGFVDMGRFPSLLHDMQGHGRLPSSHDLEVYRLDNKMDVQR